MRVGVIVGLQWALIDALIECPFSAVSTKTNSIAGSAVWTDTCRRENEYQTCDSGQRIKAMIIET